MENSPPSDVHNLEVEGQHEYFADGILVHNSMDSLRYALFTHSSGPEITRRNARITKGNIIK